MKKSLVKIVAFVLMAVMTVGLSSYYSGTSVRAETAASEQDVEGKRIYFAAPLFNEAEREYNLKLVTLLESYGYEVFLPQRDGFLAPELEGKTEEEKTEETEKFVSLQRRIGSQADMLNFVRGRAAVKLLALFSTQKISFKNSTFSVHFHESIDTKNALQVSVRRFEAVRKGPQFPKNCTSQIFSTFSVHFGEN